MSRKRNEQATCGTCVYWKDMHGNGKSYCCKYSSKGVSTSVSGNQWCGEHPEFWEEEAVQPGPPASASPLGAVAEALRAGVIATDVSWAKE